MFDCLVQKLTRFYLFSYIIALQLKSKSKDPKRIINLLTKSIINLHKNVSSTLQFTPQSLDNYHKSVVWKFQFIKEPITSPSQDKKHLTVPNQREVRGY